jgi:hypothetical protein
MRRNLYNTEGFYTPSYFRIKVNTDDSFLSFDENLSELGAAIFLHEYIHYLQDITTTHGLFNIISEVDFIKLFNSKLQGEDVESLEVPFSSAPEDGTVNPNLEMRKIWIGAGEQRSQEGDYVVGTEINNLNFNGTDYPLNRFYLQWGNPEEGGVKYYFGCIVSVSVWPMKLSRQFIQV